MPQEIVRDEGLFPFERVHLERLLLAADVILELSGEGPINDVLEVELREFRERVQLTLLRLHSSPSAGKSAARLLAEISSATGRGTMATLGRFGQSLAFPTFAHDPPLSLCVVRTPIAAIIVVALLLAGIAGCEAKPATDGMPGPASQRADTAPSIAGPGQDAPGSAVPWDNVGPGWALVQGWTTTPAKNGKQASNSEALYLADPAGGKYTLFTWADTATGAAVPPPGMLFDWSGDKQRALFGHVPSQSDPGGLGPTTELNLRTGKRTTIPVSQKDIVVGYTRPGGDQVLVETTISTLVSTVDVVSRAGKATARLSRGFVAANPVSTPDGRAYVVTADDGNHLVSTTGKTIRHLNSGGAGCAPVRWWDAGTLLATCTMDPCCDDDQQVWLIPASGKAPTALTPRRPVGTGPDLGDFNYVRLDSGNYVDARGPNCGQHVLARLEPGGKIAVVKVPGATEAGIVAATSSRLLLLTQSASCDGSAGISEGLIWLNPKTGAKTTVIPVAKDSLLQVVPYYDVGEH